jgi:outer membrane lipoprotein-sorting protein
MIQTIVPRSLRISAGLAFALGLMILLPKPGNAEPLDPAKPAAAAAAAAAVATPAAVTPGPDGPVVPAEAATPGATPEATPGTTPEAIKCADLDLDKLLDRVDDTYRGTRSTARVSMRMVTEHWERELEIVSWSEGTEKSLMRILSPKKEKGTATLMVDENVWNYLPKVKRVIKVPSSMMGGAWMGSHFTNDDLVKQSRMVKDFTFDKTYQGERNGRTEIEVTLTPRPDAAVVWGKIVVVVDEATCLPVRQVYYDEDMDLARSMFFEEPKVFDGVKLPSVMRVVPADKPKELTEVRYHELEFDVDLPKDIFSIRKLKR